MYIKEFNKEEKNKITFKVSPVFSTLELVKRCRKICDDFYTYRNYENFSENYNFRKCCLEANVMDYKVKSITMTGFKYKEKEFTVDVFLSGDVLLSYGDEFDLNEVDSLADRFTRIINYAL